MSLSFGLSLMVLSIQSAASRTPSPAEIKSFQTAFCNAQEMSQSKFQEFVINPVQPLVKQGVDPSYVSGNWKEAPWEAYIPYFGIVVVALVLISLLYMPTKQGSRNKYVSVLFCVMSFVTLFSCWMAFGYETIASRGQQQASCIVNKAIDTLLQGSEQFGGIDSSVPKNLMRLQDDPAWKAEVARFLKGTQALQETVKRLEKSIGFFNDPGLMGYLKNTVAAAKNGHMSSFLAAFAPDSSLWINFQKAVYKSDPVRLVQFREMVESFNIPDHTIKQFAEAEKTLRHIEQTQMQALQNDLGKVHERYENAGSSWFTTVAITAALSLMLLVATFLTVNRRKTSARSVHFSWITFLLFACGCLVMSGLGLPGLIQVATVCDMPLQKLTEVGPSPLHAATVNLMHKCLVPGGDSKLVVGFKGGRIKSQLSHLTFERGATGQQTGFSSSPLFHEFMYATEDSAGHFVWIQKFLDQFLKQDDAQFSSPEARDIYSSIRNAVVYPTKPSLHAACKSLNAEALQKNKRFLPLKAIQATFPLLEKDGQRVRMVFPGTGVEGEDITKLDAKKYKNQKDASVLIRLAKYIHNVVDPSKMQYYCGGQKCNYDGFVTFMELRMKEVKTHAMRADRLFADIDIERFTDLVNQRILTPITRLQKMDCSFANHTVADARDKVCRVAAPSLVGSVIMWIITALLSVITAIICFLLYRKEITADVPLSVQVVPSNRFGSLSDTPSDRASDETESCLTRPSARPVSPSDRFGVSDELESLLTKPMHVPSDECGSSDLAQNLLTRPSTKLEVPSDRISCLPRTSTDQVSPSDEALETEDGFPTRPSTKLVLPTDR